MQIRKFRPKHALILVVTSVLVYMMCIAPVAMLIVLSVCAAAFGLVYLIIATTENSWNPLDW